MPDPVTAERVREAIDDVLMDLELQRESMTADTGGLSGLFNTLHVCDLRVEQIKFLAAFARQVLAEPYCRECDKTCRHRENNA